MPIQQSTDGDLQNLTDDSNKVVTKESAGNSFWKRVGEFIENVATLDVVTMTGTIDLNVSQPNTTPETSKNAWKNIIEQAKVVNTSKVQAVAISHFEFDQDAVMFVSEDAVDNQKELLDLHNKTVDTAQKIRTQVVTSAMSIFD